MTAQDGAVRIQDKHGNVLNRRGRYTRRSFRDAWPLTPADDVAAIRAEEARRIDAYGELPDLSEDRDPIPADFNDYETYATYMRWCGLEAEAI